MTLHEDIDITDILSDSEFLELSARADEPITENSISYEEFKSLLEQWRAGLNGSKGQTTPACD